MTVYSSRFLQLRTAALLALALALTACGAPSDGSDNAATNTNTSASAVPASTQLRDLSVPADASFSNFAASTLTLDIPSFSLAGQNVFLKLYLPEGNTLFFGRVDQSKTFSMTLDLPLSSTLVRYELVSDSTQDQLIRGEIAL